ncbi:hypothetical protein JB92DRAFT_2806791 [Gautieria morchelliformis]|nr:hypothetical protein JB92DRAFT_2806791 [Gautieria morchelliformis]
MFQLSVLIIPAIACEGQCIVGITHAFVGNYTTPVHNVFIEAANKISHHILHSRSSPTAYKLMEPLRSSYQNNAYNAMEKAIFPSYFHGKCQVNGADPVGCPNPDCPVVCGTPGSLVHFYAVLQQIAFNVTASSLLELCKPSSSAYQAFQTAILHELRTESPSRPSPTRLWNRRITRPDLRVALEKRRKNGEGVSGGDIKARLKSVCQSMVKDLTSQCRGSGRLSKCSWEQEMKVSSRNNPIQSLSNKTLQAFILSFP